jgi:sterol desaturase/sphingolipid hydroxylase (fatty acid hydroxylase superfamily)
MARRLVQLFFFPLVLFGGMVTAWLALRGGGRPGLAVTLSVAIAGVLIFAMEHVLPLEPGWRPSRRRAALDLAHTVLFTSLLPALIRAALLGGLTEVALLVAYDGSLWPSRWPLPLQIALGLVVADLGAYWVHRICHTWEPAWRIHALHHSSDRMYVLAGGRNHPFNVLFAYAAQTAPQVLLGAPAHVIALVGLFTALHGLLRHSNLDLRLGPFNWILSGPELHRRHHARDVAESSTNFSPNTALWDIVFGTFHHPPGRPSHAVGMDELELADDFWLHLRLPFVYARLTASDGAESPPPTTCIATAPTTQVPATSARPPSGSSSTSQPSAAATTGLTNA